MLKKLVKYGNSNALVIDKAILEILNIQEGATVKIKTDGTSIIITPQKAVPAQEVNETYTAMDAYHESAIQEMLKSYRTTDAATSAKLAELLKKKHALSREFHKNKDLRAMLNDEVNALKAEKKHAKLSPEELGLKALNNVKVRHAHKLVKAEKEFDAFVLKHNLLPNSIQAEKQETMTQEFMALNKKHKDALAALHDVMLNPEFIHQSQLLAEKFKGNQDSTEFIKASQKLQYQFVPGLKQYHKEMMAVTKKYTPEKQ